TMQLERGIYSAGAWNVLTRPQTSTVAPWSSRRPLFSDGVRDGMTPPKTPNPQIVRTSQRNKFRAPIAWIRLSDLRSWNCSFAFQRITGKLRRRNMIPNEETTQPTEQPEQPRAARPVSTSRPRRPRPPRLRTRPPEISKITEQNIPESVPEPAAAAQQQATDIESPDTTPKAFRETAAPRPQSQGRSPALSEAIEEVTQVIGALKQTLYDLEEVLE